MLKMWWPALILKAAFLFYVMKKVFTTALMLLNCGCYSREQLMNCSFMQNDRITLEDILSSEIHLKDKYWFVCKKLLTNDQNKEVAIAVAEIVLPIYEKRHPEDTRVRECIEASKLFIRGHISLAQLIEKRSVADYGAAYGAAYAAYAAAYAAYAAAKAAAAVVAADAAYAAYAAANAANAAAANAVYVSYAADSLTYKELLLQYLIDFCFKA